MNTRFTFQPPAEYEAFNSFNIVDLSPFPNDNGGSISMMDFLNLGSMIREIVKRPNVIYHLGEMCQI